MLALYAFNLEVVRIRELARGPLAGEIRLQWWSDVLAGERHGEWQGHPVAAALTVTIEAHGLPRARLAKLLDARRFDLYTDAMQALADLEAYADAVSTTLIMLSAQILAAGREPDIGEVAHHAGVACAIAGLLNAFPIHVRQGQLFVPIEVLQRHGTDREALATGHARAELKTAFAELRRIARGHLDRARDLAPSIPAALLPALLPVAPVRAMLARMERKGDPFAPVEIAPWRRQWIIWRAARRPSRLFL
jgi:15-cis-phytoene synthase